jgi:hypothetical protein
VHRCGRTLGLQEGQVQRRQPVRHPGPPSLVRFVSSHPNRVRRQSAATLGRVLPGTLDPARSSGKRACPTPR